MSFELVDEGGQRAYLAGAGRRRAVALDLIDAQGRQRVELQDGLVAEYSSGHYAHCRGGTMIVIRFKVQLQPDKLEEAVAALAAVVAPSRALDGVVSFDIGQDVTDPSAIIATEVFADEAAVERQGGLPEVARVMSLMPQVAARPPEATMFQVSSTSDMFAAA